MCKSSAFVLMFVTCTSVVVLIDPSTWKHIKGRNSDWATDTSEELQTLVKVNVCLHICVFWGHVYTNW